MSDPHYYQSQQARAETSASAWWKGFCCGELSLVHFLFLVLLGFLAYGHQFLSPAFLADDVIQLQPASKDSQMFLQAGRWGYYLVFRYLLDEGSGGLAAGSFGLIFQIYAAYLVASTIRFRNTGATFFFCAFFVVHVFYAHLFAFDSTRLAYPIGNLLAALGLYAGFRRRHVIAIGCFALAPAFYPAAIQIGVAGAVVAVIVGHFRGEPGGGPSDLLRYAFLIFFGLVTYFVSMKVGFKVFEIPPLERSDFEISTLFSVEYFARLERLFLSWSVPFISGFRTTYFTNLVVWPYGIFFLLFAYLVLKTMVIRREIFGGGFLMILFFVLLVSPYLLAFAAPMREEFDPRSLYVFGLVGGAFAAVPFDGVLVQWSRSIGGRWEGFYRILVRVLAVLMMAMLAGNIILANKFSTDDQLASQSDLLAVNRIIYRAEQVAASAGLDARNSIPIHVFVKSSWRQAGPRGDLSSARYPAWSKDWIFRLVDNRFIPLPAWHRAIIGEELDRLAKSRSAWPHEDSVFVEDGIVVVVL